MSALSPELLYFASRMSGFSTNIFKLETQNQSTATSNSIVAMDLPSNSIINLRSFKMFFECNANAIAAQGGRLPPVKDLVERVEVSMGGVVLSQGTNFVNVLSEAKKAVSAEYCDATLGHPEYIRATSYVNPADTLATTANENDANTSYCIDEWEGFLGTADPMLFDTSLVPMMRVRCYMATDNVLSSVSTSVLGTAAGNFADSAGTDATTGPPLNSTAVGSPKYALSDIRATIECISIADMTLENMLASQMSAQWRDPVVNPELIALGFESAAQLGSLFMADADLLADLTANVQPVTDNHPARISSRLVNYRGYIELYGMLMDESQRLERFRNSELINERWPAELRNESERFFLYERLIKNHLTGNAYRNPSDTYSWEAIDDLLTNTSLTTLPMWLLGSDRATQEILEGLLESDGYRSEFALDMARKYTADRDYKTALMYLNDHITTTGEVTQWASNFYLYLLARNGLAEQAGPIISRLENLGEPEIDRFLDWYTRKFEQSVAAN